VCGIVGYVGYRDAVGVLLPGLRRLEYRGYDSAGVATGQRGRLAVRKTAGKVGALEALVALDRPCGTVGIAHTRWATHGRPSATNAHPHLDCQGRLAVVHNGIIENYRELRRRLAAAGHRFRSETDTEVIAHLVEHYWEDDLPEAVRHAASELRGAFAVACLAAEIPQRLVAVRQGGSPLVIGLDSRETFLASDIPALLSETREVVILEDGELTVLEAGRAVIRTLQGKDVQRAVTTVDWNSETAEKGGYPHFMLKEIFEQPEAVRNTMRDRVDVETGDIRIPGIGLRDRELIGLSRLCFVACGTSWHAGLIGKLLVEEFARLPVEVDIASEFRYRRPVLDGRVLTVPISQSGETADTLAAQRAARDQGSRIVAICNVVGSSIAREADGVVYTRAGLEIGVASTKAFTAQFTAIVLLALKLGQARGTVDPLLSRAVVKALWEVPALMDTVLVGCREQTRQLAALLAKRDHCLYLGRGVHYPMALEGALKLKEISYIHAEGYPAGEMKHGPIALIDKDMPIVAIAPQGLWSEKMASNLEEVKARDGFVIAIESEGDSEVAAKADAVVRIPRTLSWIEPLLVAPVLQLLAYHVGILRGCDVDQPRNLAKSVTVE
jgi:glucosamine--fructose-6-phosphate aminotransferase (isomerizing)